ncbi:MAG: DUF721 domain-containing protein [Pseudomonadota bacterium]
MRRYSRDILARVARSTRYVDPTLAEKWPDIVGADISAICRPGRLSGGRQGRTLEIHVNSSAAAAAVEFNERAIIDSLNEYYGPGVIGHVRVQRVSGGPPAPSRGNAPLLGSFRR